MLEESVKGKSCNNFNEDAVNIYYDSDEKKRGQQGASLIYSIRLYSNVPFIFAFVVLYLWLLIFSVFQVVEPDSDSIF